MRGVLVLMVLGLGLTACQSAPNAPDPTHPETAQTDSKEQVFYAEFSAPCGRSLLEIASQPGEPPQLVQASGPESPIQKLRLHALLTGRFKVVGTLTKQHADDGHCGAYPVFEVTRFEPWGDVKRCTSVGALDPALQLYTEALPADRYAPEDFEGGPELPMILEDTCHATQDACADGKTRVTGCDGTSWCCALMP